MNIITRYIFVSGMQSRFDIHKSICIIYYIYGIENRYHMIILIDAKTVLSKNSILVIKENPQTVSQIGRKRYSIRLITRTYKNRELSSYWW